MYSSIDLSEKSLLLIAVWVFNIKLISALPKILRAFNFEKHKDMFIDGEVLLEHLFQKIRQQLQTHINTKMSTTKLFNLSSQQAFKKLPEKLQNFFTRYPPAPIKTYSNKPTLTNAVDANPFLPNIHPVTKTVQEPVYSLRRQSDLYKLAYKFGISDLMPTLRNDKKFFQEKYDTKPMLRGVLRPKGHKWERTFDERKKKIADALEQVDDILVKHRGAKYKKRLERRKSEQKTWY